MIPLTSWRAIWRDAGKGSALPIAALAIVMLMIVPAPAWLLDVGFIANIALSLGVLMVAIRVAKPLDFSSFPTVLLFSTLLRLSLNVASTRVVLSEGHKGGAAAGHVIEAFGTVAIGSSWAVGLFVFAIIMIINLVVITKGAGRVSEVSARFTLDALPGKQMAIDADLNAGLLTAEEARQRRQDVATEADFYGSMDGASKFVKGDAIAGVLVLAINILGGITLGATAHGMALGEAADAYVKLAVGDALVAQVPALLLSIAAAAIVTRVNSPLDLSGQVGSQFARANAWAPVAVILGVLALIPGMPHLLVGGAAVAAGYAAWRLDRRARQADVPQAPVPLAERGVDWDDVDVPAGITLDLGYSLIRLVDERAGAPLMARLTAIRRQLTRELGFVIPPVRVRDELTLAPDHYRISIGGAVAGEGILRPGEFLALDAGDVDTPVAGLAVKDPTFGLDALWINADTRSAALAAGYTVVDASTVVATHVNRLIEGQAAELFGLDEAQAMLDALKERAPELARALTPQPFTLAQVTGVLRALLAEGVAVREFARIAHAMLESAPLAASPKALVEAVRQRIGALIVQRIAPPAMPLAAITYDGQLEVMMAQAVMAAPDAAWPIEPQLGQRIADATRAAALPLIAEARPFAVVTGPAARPALARLLRPHLPDVPVLSFMEVPDSRAVDVVAVVGGEEAMPALLTGGMA